MNASRPFCRRVADLLPWLTPLVSLLAPGARAGGEPCLYACENPQEECIDYLCRPAPPCSDCEPKEESCADDGDCPHWKKCQDGLCVLRPLPECGDVKPCADGEECIEGQCAPVVDPECTVTRPCPEGDICVAGHCEPGEPTPECRSDSECRTGRCEDYKCVPRFYDPPGLTPISLPRPPLKRTHDDDPPVWNLPDDDDPFGDIPPGHPEACASDEQGAVLCCSPVTGWSFEKDEVDEQGVSLYQPWTAAGSTFGRGPVYGNNVHIDRIMPPGYTNAAAYGPASNVGGDYWAFSRDVNQQGKWWIGSSDLRSKPSESPGVRIAEASTGTLTSPRFIVDSDYIRFFIGGTSKPSERVQLEIYAPDATERAALGKLYDGIGVSELIGAAGYLPVPPEGSDWVVVRASAPKDGNEYMHRRVAWDVKDFRGKKARIVIVDTDKWGWHPAGGGHVNVDEVLCTDELEDGPTWATLPKSGRPAKVGEKETPIPLWGTTDTHTHPYTNLAFGGHLLWGDPSDELKDVYSCNGELPEIADGGILLRGKVTQVEPDECSGSTWLGLVVAALPCEVWYGIPFVGVALAATCQEARWDVLDVTMNQSLVRAESLHGSPSPLSGGITMTGAKEVMQELTPFMNTFGDVFPEADLPDFGQMTQDMPDHVPGLVERLAWDTDDGRHSQHDVKGHQIYQKDMIRRAYQGGMRLIGLDVIDSRTISLTLGDPGYDEWITIRDTVYSARHLVSCGTDPLFPTPGPLCDIAGIAYSPADVRALVKQNKLAIVLGTETDELGVPRRPETLVLYGHPFGTTDSIELQIADLHDLGIRKVTAIHALNNPLGGAGIFNDTYLTGTNELSNELDPNAVSQKSLEIPFFLAGKFTDDFMSINHLESDPNAPSWDDWYNDHGGWVGIDQTLGDDWIGYGGVTFEYGFPSVATPLGFAATSANITDDGVADARAFHAKGSWGGVNEVAFTQNFDQLITGGAMCSVDGAGLPLPVHADRVPKQVKTEHLEEEGQGFSNKIGLQKMGRTAIEELMKRGMIIDLDHFSHLARLDTREVAEEVGAEHFEDTERLYPFFGVHTNSRVHERHGPFPDFEDLRKARGYNAETDRTVPEFERQKKDGGAFSPGANAGYMTDMPEEQDPQVRNDCDYSAKSFAHRYLWMMEIMDGRGLTPSTDMSPFFTAAAPRFGQNQCHLRTSYHDDMVGLETAKDKDGNPLEFPHWCAFWDFPDQPISKLIWPHECKSDQWPHDWMPDSEAPGGNGMCKIWGKDLADCPTYKNLEEQMKEGAAVWYEDYAGRELPAEEQPAQEGSGPQVVYIAARRADENRDDAAPRAKIQEVVSIGGARQLWPMKKMKTSAGWKLDQSKNTGWDVNLDGFPHIGLFPDFLQDVRNVGVSWERMTPMFNAVEDYVRMWERDCELANKWAAKDSSVPGCK